MSYTKQEALDYHSSGRKGKLEIVPCKPTGTSRDLTLAYSPGVAEPCLAIEKEPELSYRYTARGNLVAVIRDFRLYASGDATTNPDFENVPHTDQNGNPNGGYTGPWEDKGIVDAMLDTPAIKEMYLRRLRSVMDELLQRVLGAAKLVDEMAAASSGQSGEIDQVSQSVRQMDGATQQNATLVDIGQLQIDLRNAQKALETATNVYNNAKDGFTQCPACTKVWAYDRMSTWEDAQNLYNDAVSRLQQVQTAIDQAQRGNELAITNAQTTLDKAQRNFTDGDSRIMKAGDGFIQGYNCQAAVDAEHQIIVAEAVTNQPPDVEHLAPMLEQVVENCGAAPESITADTGYFSEKNVAKAEAMGIDPYIATERWKRGEPRPVAPRGRSPADLTPKQKMKRKLLTQAGLAIYARRKTTVEPVFGQIKQARGLRQFLLRGIEKARAEWSLMCLTHNLLKLHRAGAAA